jgi:hypothetical protein
LASGTSIMWPAFYDVMLPILGLILTLTAAYDFRDLHSRARNIASGTLDENATVTVSEMIEHSFYQMLNIFQALYVHIIESFVSRDSFWIRLILLSTVTLPWIFRGLFPVNSFSSNYEKSGRDPWAFTSIL